MSDIAKTFGAALHGVEATIITIEVNVAEGVRFHVSGLPDKAIKESEHRIESSIKESGFWFPRNKTVVNLAPADIRKEGSLYDLPIALCVLQSSGQVNVSDLDQYRIMGELSLDGNLRAI